jgi:hypothetical protein
MSKHTRNCNSANAASCLILFSALAIPATAQSPAIFEPEPSDPVAVALKAHPGWVQIPGALIHPDCVHEVPNGAVLQENGDVLLGGALVAHFDNCPESPVRTRPLHQLAPQFVDAPGTGNGWAEAIQENVPLKIGDNIDKITGRWTVPNDPSTNGALIYMFNGLEPSTQNLIIQPVLQYGATTAGGLIGGNYWVVASWMVGKTAVHSAGVIVNPGDTIVGTTSISSVSGGKTYWNIQAVDTTTHSSSGLIVSESGHTWNWAYAGVLEAYNVTSCGELPASSDTAFVDTTVYHGYPSFKAVITAWGGALYPWSGPSCGFTPVPGVNVLFY